MLSCEQCIIKSAMGHTDLKKILKPPLHKTIQVEF